MVDGQQYVAILAGARGLPPGGKRTVGSSANNSRILRLQGWRHGAASDRDDRRCDGPSGRTDQPAAADRQQRDGGFGRAAVRPPIARSATDRQRFRPPARSPRTCATAPCSPTSRRGTAPCATATGARAACRASAASPTAEQTDNILAYVIKRANDEKAVQEAAASRPN